MDNVITRETDFFKDLISKIKTMETQIESMKDGNLTCRNKWMNGDEVMQKLGISRRTLQNYRDCGILPHSIVGGKFYYSFNDIEGLMKDNYFSAKR